MIGKNNRKLRAEKSSNKVYKYAIKRLSVGVASVAVAAGLLFSSEVAVAQAAESTATEETTGSDAGATPEVIDTTEETASLGSTSLEENLESADTSLTEDPIVEEENTDETVDNPELSVSGSVRLNEGEVLSETAIRSVIQNLPGDAAISATEIGQVMDNPGTTTIQATVQYADGTSEVVTVSVNVLVVEEEEPVKYAATENEDRVAISDDNAIEDPNLDDVSYIEPNWDEKSNEEDSSFWRIGENQNLSEVNVVSDPLAIFQLNYAGNHLDEDGSTVIDLMYSIKTRSASAVWQNAHFHFGQQLMDLIDWNKSYVLNDDNEKKYFAAGLTNSDKKIALSNMYQADLAGGVHYAPISLFLKTGKTMADLDGINTIVQSRITSANDQDIYTRTLEGEVNAKGYGAYTTSTQIPNSTSPRLDVDVLPELPKYTALTRDFPAITNTQIVSSYDDEDNVLQVASIYSKSGTSNDYTNDGDGVAYRQSFNKSFINLLKEDENGYIGYLKVARARIDGTTSDITPDDGRIGIRMSDINIDGDVAFIKIASDNFVGNPQNHKVIYANGGVNYIMDNQESVLLGAGITAIDYNLDSEMVQHFIRMV